MEQILEIAKENARILYTNMQKACDVLTNEGVTSKTAREIVIHIFNDEFDKLNKAKSK